MTETLKCKYHPGRETSVSCSSCGQGLCPECMVYSSVGIKCKDCARPTRGMLRQGKPTQYVGAVVAGVLSAAIGGFVLMFSFRGSILLNLLLGVLIAEAVRRGAKGNKGPTFSAIAAVSAFMGLAISGYVFSVKGLILGLVVSGVAAYRLNS